MTLTRRFDETLGRESWQQQHRHGSGDTADQKGSGGAADEKGLAKLALRIPNRTIQQYSVTFLNQVAEKRPRKIPDAEDMWLENIRRLPSKAPMMQWP